VFSLDCAIKADPPTRCTKAQAKLNVFQKTECRIEAVHRLERGPPNGAQPRPERLRLCRSGLMHIVMQQVAVSADHGDIRRRIIVGAEDRNGVLSHERGAQTVYRVAMHRHVGVDEEQKICLGRLGTEVARTGRAKGGCRRYDMNTGVPGDLRRGVTGGIVHDDDLSRVHARRTQRVKTLAQRRGSVAGRDDRGHAWVCASRSGNFHRHVTLRPSVLFEH
jgi:hypothetical protein